MNGPRHVFNKSKLRDILLQVEAVSMKDAIDLYQSHLEGARADLSEAADLGQRSQQEQSGVEAERFEDQSHLHEQHRDVIQSISFGPSDVVEAGAVVDVSAHYFVIAVPTAILHLDGFEIVGISVESPLFEAMAGLKAGQRFEFNQRSFTINDVQ